LDLVFGNAFFTFPNPAATLGIGLLAVGGTIPLEEFLFYLGGFGVVLLTYVWADEYWMAAYNIPDYAAATAGMPRLVQFHWPSLAVGAGLLVAALLYKKLWSPVPAGFPWYITYLVAAAFVPSAGFFRTAQPFINWRAFSFTFFVIVLVSLLWEATLALPYGWWGYRATAMLGLTIGAWSQLPVEAVSVWLAVSFTTVIGYEVVKIWLATGKRALEAFFRRPASLTARCLQGEVFCKSDMASLLRHTVGSVKTHNEKERSHVLPGRFRPMADDDYATSVPSEQAASHRLGSLELRHGAGPLVRPDGGESRAGQGDAAQRTDGAPAAAGMVL